MFQNVVDGLGLAIGKSVLLDECIPPDGPFPALFDLAKLGGGADAVGSYHIGTISNFAVRVVRGMPQYYGFGWKSYGARSQRNPLRVRLGKGESAWRVVAMKDPHSPTGQLPIQHMMLFMEFGVGVADRTNGTARYTVSGTWADGTAT